MDNRSGGGVIFQLLDLSTRLFEGKNQIKLAMHLNGIICFDKCIHFLLLSLGERGYWVSLLQHFTARLRDKERFQQRISHVRSSVFVHLWDVGVVVVEYSSYLVADDLGGMHCVYAVCLKGRGNRKQVHVLS